MEIPGGICGFFGHNWKLPAYSRASLLTVLPTASKKSFNCKENSFPRFGELRRIEGNSWEFSGDSWHFVLIPEYSWGIWG